MLRNLVLKLPTLKTSSDYAFSSSLRLRNFRSLSPVQRERSPVNSDRSISCSRVKSEHVVDLSRTPRPRTLDFCKKGFAQKHDDIKEIRWRDDPSKQKEERTKEEGKKSEAVHFETLEQYELEAAKPRPARNQNVIEAFSIPKAADNGLYHLQPSQIQPYGSQNSMYSPSLIRPTNLLKYPRKFKKKKDSQKQDENSNTDLDTGYRNYCTTTDTRQLSTSKRYVAKEGYSSRDVSKNASIASPHKKNSTSKVPITPKQEGETNFNIVKRVSQTYKEPWAEPKKKLEFSPPMFQTKKNIVDHVDMDIKFSTPEMRRQRREKENQHSISNYKSSYSDLVKLKLKRLDERQLDLSNLGSIEHKSSTGNNCLECIPKNMPKSSQILQIAKSMHEKRSLTTRSKSNLLSNEGSPIILDSATTFISKKSLCEVQRNYSKSKCTDKKEKKLKKTPGLVDRAGGCDDICTPNREALKKLKKPHIPMEPESCEPQKIIKKVYLPSHVKLGVPPCTPPPAYEDCKKVEKCPPRADECLEITPKKLPKLPINDCVCLDPYQPTKAPKMKELNLKFEDPPKVVCHPPPCQIPRADDSNPYKFKPLKPYVPGDCDCVPTPKMTDVKLKRLPRCEPEDVCRPPRICPVIEKCPPRADECLKIEPKQLPPIKNSACPCIDPPIPKMAPPIKRLDLKVPEPPRVCPRPPPCKDKDRADNNLKLKKKKLPKFVPGDCPCEDKPMIDWNPKRLVCEDEEEDCVVPDPCKAFPRADWGCWEYQDQVCEEVDPKCIEKDIKCPPPEPPKRPSHPCDKANVCRDHSAGIRELRHFPKRRYSSNSNVSLKLYQQVKSQNHCEDDGYIKTGKSLKYRPPEIKQSKSKLPKPAIKVGFPTKKLKSKSTLSLVKMLNDFEKSKKNMEEPHLFKPKDNEKVNYEAILKKIAASGVPVPKNENKAGYLSPNMKQSKSIPLKVTSRAISTIKNVGIKDEKDIKQVNDNKVKKACKAMRPSIKSMCQRKKCPSITMCRDKAREHRPSCKRVYRPVCCEKEESPYSAFTDNLQCSIKPFTKTPQWNCNSPTYGFYPNPKREYDPFYKSKNKDKKKFSTFPEMENEVPSPLPPTPCSGRPMSDLSTRTVPIVSPKELLKMSTNSQVIITQNRTLSSKIFKIQKPVPGKPKANKKCMGKSIEVSKGKKISCVSTEEISKPRWCCVRERTELDCKRKPPPFPAFSDCLDEEMEDLLTECPLDKEKYHRMQPRFIYSKKPFTLKPPPPIQGKIDLLKEEQCLREKLCIKNEGLTQSCSEFGKPIPLMKTRKVIKEKNKDCERIEELKKLRRWPPPINVNYRRMCTSAPATALITRRNLSTFGLNLTSEPSKDSSKPLGANRLYIRNYHALVKSSDKAILADNDAKLKELTKKIFPDIDDCTKVLKLRNNQWKISTFKKYELLNRHGNIAKRARRFCSTYKTKRRSFLKRYQQGCTLKSGLIRRRVSNNAKLFRYRTTNLRGTRSLKTGNPLNIVKRRTNKVDTSKKGHSKFTLNSGLPKDSLKDVHKKTSEKYGHKPFSPFPAFAERKPFSGSSERQHIQSMNNVLRDNCDHLVQQYPEQEMLDRNLRFEYYKCKHGLKNEGTLDCESLGICSKCKHSDNSSNKAEPKFKPRKKTIVELFVQEHKKSNETNSCKQCKRQPCSCQTREKANEDECSEDKKKLEEICMQHCLKCIPCHLPEEEKYCVCREECSKIFQKATLPQEPLVDNQEECKEEEIICESNPEPIDNTDCDKAELESDCMEPEPAKKITKLDKSFRYDANKMMECSECPPAPCGTKNVTKSKSVTQLENIWQKIVNYFKARPNCPEPGEWKKKALKEKAEKAAKAAGLVVLNPKCLPPEILRTAKVSTNDCKICTTKDSGDKRDCDGDINKSTSPRLSKRNFSTVVQPSRNFSSSQNLNEINRLLDESEILERQLKYRNSNPNFRKELAIFPERKDFETSKALQMSLDNELSRDIDLEELCCKDEQHSGTYFGYSDIIPSRENILERAWRISIESYNKYNYPKSYTFFNEFLNKIEKSIQSVEDLEKLKTENVLRELDEFLKNEDSDKNKK